MVNHFSQYTVLLLFTTSIALVMVTVASSEACKKDDGVGDNYCSSLQQLNRCEEKIYYMGGKSCNQEWCFHDCKLKHVGKEAMGICRVSFLRRPSPYPMTVLRFCSCVYNC
ncbi:hypothetical protein HN51_065819 [Arachis hypogaea]|uniref:uncharacterized protein LOC107637709 n=1 Tax=Arachis ipaensis TaxID=130454 RepID=UPI0007AFC406|nr:uncharacterized protein LOC107637709 [Arachis ipaensis]XP_025644883.1 uncharacterized protein LOC112740343 [Arachis hypogaea]QHO06811.1 uncharacterized protein DS421_14g458030 [Arachis hypogaea]